MKKVSLLAVVISCLFMSCSNSSSTTQAALLVAPASEASQASNVSAILWQQTAAEYEALCYQAFNIAKDKLDKTAHSGADDKRNIIIMDLDETVIDNSPYEGQLILDNLDSEKARWNEWVNRSEAKMVPGALNFIKYAEELNTLIYYISNRSYDNLDVTLSFLQQKEILVDRSNLLFKDDGSISSKEDRRISLQNEFNIIMLIGDNLADFHTVFDFESVNLIGSRKDVLDGFKEEFGRKFIILPNLMYGDWEKALDINDQGSIKNSGRGRIKYMQGTH